MREQLRFQTNVPETVVLAFPDGLQVEGRFGDQFLYTWEDDRVSYLVPAVREKLQGLGVGQGDAVTICKRETKAGNRRSIEWIVQRASEPAPPQAAKPEGGAAHKETLGSQPQSISKTDGTGNGKGHVQTPYTATGAGDFLLSALVNSVDILLAVQQYARTKGLDLPFTIEDVRALAITAFINAREGGRR